MSEVYGRYVDTAGNYHYSDVETGHHVIPNTAVGSSQSPCLIKTNADRIRAMSDEELAEFINMVWGNGHAALHPNNGWAEWLKEEVKE